MAAGDLSSVAVCRFASVGDRVEVTDPEARGHDHLAVAVAPPGSEPLRRDQVADHLRRQLATADGSEQRQDLAVAQVPAVDVDPADPIGPLEVLQRQRLWIHTGKPNARLADQSRRLLAAQPRDLAQWLY